jgi:hypothetical protein
MYLMEGELIMSDSWNTLPFLGPVPLFHADPVEDGPPLLSADGHWWWDGLTWTPVHQPEDPDAQAVRSARDAEQPASALAETG